MTSDQPGTPLRQKERQQLLANLDALGAPEAEARAEAALRVAEMVGRKGISWAALLAAGEPDDEPTAPDDWRQQVTELLRHPALAADERRFLRKIIGWKAPGTDGLRRLREISGRVGVGMRGGG